MREIIAALWIGAVLTGSVLGATYMVNPDGTGDFPTIRSAVGCGPTPTIAMTWGHVKALFAQ